MSMLDAFTDAQDRRLPRAGAAGLALKGSVARSRAEFETLALRWRGLEHFESGFNLFQSLGWARAVFEFEAARGNAAFDPVIAMIEDGQRLVGILPLERVHTGARTLLVPLGHAFAQISDVLLDASADPVVAVEHLLKLAIAAAPSDAVSFLKVRAGSALDRGLPRTKIQTGELLGSPYVALDSFEDFASYFSTVRPKTRKNMRNARNRLEREGAVAHQTVEDAAEQRALIERTLDGRAERLKEQGLTSRAFGDSDFFAFCKSLATCKDLNVLAFALTHDGRPLAEQWGFEHGGRYYAFVANRDFSHSDESPGKLHLREILEYCARRGFRGCDLGVPVMPYKLTFATETVPVRDYSLPITPRGWAIIMFWDILLRPNIKRMVLAMPTSWRARLMRLAKRGQHSQASKEHS